jgi:hypothetical protein
MTRIITLLLLTIGLAITGCANTEPKAEFPTERGPDDQPLYGDRPSIFGPDGLKLFSTGSNGKKDDPGTGIGVNAYLWRASLDTISFMPINSADPFGGTIITDWYQPRMGDRLSDGDQEVIERFKLNVFITSQRLRADGVRVAAFRQVKEDEGQWQDAQISPEVADKLELAILSRARELRRRGLSPDQ